jgi:pyruvate/2-oxoglutarate/acetoin dehydrogenase E1 component
MPNKKIFFYEAINEALNLSLKKNKNTLIMGLGSDDPKNIFGTTKNLQEIYGKNRVIDLPTSENACMGIAIGLSINKIKPIISHQRVEFALLAFEQIVNQAAKFNYTTAGKLNIPIVVRLIIGRGWGQGTQHSQSLESIFSHFPGLKVIAPSNANDAKGLMLSSIEDKNPVMFYEHRWLHNTNGFVKNKYFKTPIGKAKIIKKGKDITVVSFSYMIIEAIKSINYLKKFKVNIELIDLRTIKPMDTKTIIKSVKKTRRLLVIDGGWTDFGVGAEVVSKITQKLKLKTLPKIIGLRNSPIPSSRNLSKEIYPFYGDIIYEILKMLNLKIKTKFKKNLEDVPDKNFLGPF